MSKQKILDLFEKIVENKQLIPQLSKEKSTLKISNLVGSSLSFIVSECFKKTNKPFLFILNDKEEAAYYLNDFEQLLSDKDVLFYPGSYRRPYQIEETDNANILLRSEVLNRINSQKKPSLIVTYSGALFEKVVTKAELNRNTLKINLKDQLSLDFVNEVLFEYHFNRVDFVSEPGQFSVRGGIIDVFSFSHNEPYRIEFFGDEVDSIRTFDVETQLSLEKQIKISIMPNVENKTLVEKRESFLNYISSNTVVIAKNPDLIKNDLDQLFDKAEIAFQNLKSVLNHAKPNELFCNGDVLTKQLQDFSFVEIVNAQKAAPILASHQKNQINVVSFQTKPQPAFNKQFDLLIADFNENTKNGFTNYLFCDSQKQAERFHDIFNDVNKEIQYKTIVSPLYQGFIDVEHKLICYTDHQIFERYHKFRLKDGYAKKQTISLKELTNLEIGDYVTHIDHGIGKFGGLQKIDVEGKKQEAIKLIYGDRDILYISIHSLHKISKYNGKDGAAPKLYKLGSGAWAKLKQKTKARIKHIAYNLIELYAKRKMQKGLQFLPDSYLQHELEASFIYEDTPDQSSATQDVKNDMESEQPMDRLVCGDVGFGKTEIAIRAAFKAVDNGKQVAVLVPTTILAFQHFKTFTERLKDFPVHVEYLNRFRSANQRKEVLEGLANGQVDIVIGTHQLTNTSIKYKNLGLLIVDEEQKFGVAVKDKLKTLKENIDTLTLTATPIPRTLQFSLMAARDMSVINTPPPNRVPIESAVVRFNEEVIRDAIRYEIQRGGQVFFIHNRIENIKEIAGMLQRLVPDAKIGIGHGQMDGKKLEGLMLAFINNEFDVLVSTTIVESGLDVPNANTIFINNANNFGLSDLHQMRGRVGRSNKKAFCYFITPPFHMMTDDARKRINAIELFTELGSGIHIAMKDLEIRGAGDLLGGEQSGFINDIGFETYQKILNETIEELKESEFKDLYKEDADTPKIYVKEIQIDSDFEILFPDNYVNVITERLNLYNRLGELKTEIELQLFELELIDRFGPLPTQVADLLNSVRIKWIAKKLGIEKLVLKNHRMIGYFISDQKSTFFNTSHFTNVLHYVKQNPTSCVLKEKQTKNGLRLLLTFIKITSVNKALETLQNIN
ncbi:transcription-repair coupling factor [Lutibacter sp.]|uniref:transcription-repair coupling factor n=1 Tax=Lutibacter sp. TaxID=1925666 RepID=UPI002734A0D6|nr:transcription-repair coupling factor [Lutibacter sp.]MDP3313157.1 transcription-repair coupling factor [Lutibacter sp.]